MITKKQARDIAEKYLKEKKRDYTSLDDEKKIRFIPNDKVLYGKREGQIADTYLVGYAQIWGLEERLMGVIIDAKTGEVLYSISPHGHIEEWED